MPRRKDRFNFMAWSNLIRFKPQPKNYRDSHTSGSPASTSANRRINNLLTAGRMLMGKRRITVASPYLERSKALAGGRGRAAFGVTADTADALVIRIVAVGIGHSISW